MRYIFQGFFDPPLATHFITSASNNIHFPRKCLRASLLAAPNGNGVGWLIQGASQVAGSGPGGVASGSGQ